MGKMPDFRLVGVGNPLRGCLIVRNCSCASPGSEGGASWRGGVSGLRIYCCDLQQTQEEPGQGQVFVRAAGVVEKGVAVGLGVPQANYSFEEVHDALGVS